MSAPPSRPDDHDDGDDAREAATDLVVAYCFPPYVDTSAIVAAKRVRERGRRVDVLQNAMADLRPLDPDLERIAGELVVRRAELASPTHFAAWRAMSQFSALGVQQALAWEGRGEPYQHLHSRAQFAASHLLAARYTLSRPDVRWSAEFSDPLSRGADGQVRRSALPDGSLRHRLEARVARAGFAPPDPENALAWIEQVTFALADELVFTNDHQLEVMLGDVPDTELAARARAVAVVSPHPVPPPELYTVADPDLPLEEGVVHIGYFGRFYPNRGLGSVLAGLAVLPSRVRDRLRLHVFTDRDEDLAPEVARLGLEPWVRTRPFVGYLDFLALATRMDVLLLTDAATRGRYPVNPYLPSKWSDYRGAGRRIWGMVEPGSTLDGLPLDHRSPIDHATGAALELARIAAVSGPG